MSDLLGSLIVRLAADAAQFESDMGRAARIADNKAKQVEARMQAMGKVVGGALAAVATALAAGTANAIKNIDQLGDRAARLGVGAEALQELGFAASQSGTDVATLEIGLRNLSKQAAEAAGGGKQAQEMFAAIGVSVTDATGKLRPAEQLFKEIADRFEGYEDGAGKVALANQLFGKSGSALIATLNEGSEGLDQFAEKARRLGLVVSEETVAAAQEFGDQVDVLKGIWEGFFNQIAADVLPSLVSLANILVEDGEKAAEAGSSITVFGDALQWLLKIAVSINAAFQVMGKTIAAVSAYATTNASAILQLATGNGAGAAAAFRENAGRNASILSDFNTDVMAEIERAARRITAIDKPVQNVGKSAEAAAKSMGKIAPPIVKAASAAGQAEKAVEKFTDEAERLEDLRIADALAAEADEMEAVARAVEQFQIRMRNAADTLEEFSNVDQEAASFTKLEVALEDALSAGNVKLADDIRAAIERLGEAAVEASDKTSSISITSTLTETLTGTFDGLADTIAYGGDAMEMFARDGGRAITQLIGGFKDLKASGEDWQSLFIQNGKPTSAMSALGDLFGVVAEQSGGGTAGAITGAISGAMSGMSAGWWGAVIGAIVGGYAGYGGGEKNPTLTAAGNGTTGMNGTRAEASLSTPLGTITVGTRDMTNPTSRQVAQAVQDFDRTVADLLNNAQDQLARGAVSRFQFRGEGGEASLGELLEQRLEVIAASVLGSATGQFLASFSNDFQTQLAAFGDLIAIDDLIQDGRGIVDSLELAIGLVQQFGLAGESVGQTYQRISQSVSILTDAFGLADIAIMRAQAGFAALAATIVDQVGGIERATQLFNSAFELLYTDTERAQLELDQARAQAQQQLEDVGLNFADIDLTRLDSFRAQFEAALASGDAVRIQQWLEAAEALGMVSDASQRLADLTPQPAEVIDDLAERMAEVAQLMDDWAWDDYAAGLSDYDRGLAEIDRKWEERIARLQELGASQADVARAQQYWTNEIERYEEATNNAAEATRRFVVSAGELALQRQAELAAARNEFAEIRNNIQEWLNGQLLSNNSSLNPFQRLEEAQSQFDAKFAAASAGDLDALRSITGVADILLAEARAFYGSGSDFQRIEARIREQLSTFTTQSFEAQMLEVLKQIRDGIVGSNGVGPSEPRKIPNYGAGSLPIPRDPGGDAAKSQRELVEEVRSMRRELVEAQMSTKRVLETAMNKGGRT